MIRSGEGKSQHGGLTDDRNIYQLTYGAEWLITLFKLNRNANIDELFTANHTDSLFWLLDLGQLIST